MSWQFKASWCEHVVRESYESYIMWSKSRCLTIDGRLAASEPLPFYIQYRECKIIYVAPACWMESILSGIHWKLNHFLFHVCLSVSAFKGHIAHETHKHLHLTGTFVYFDFILTVYDCRLLSQYLDLAGKAKPSLFIFFLATVCRVCMYCTCALSWSKQTYLSC